MRRGDRSVAALSYGWATIDAPDPSGAAFAALRSFLRDEALGAHVRRRGSAGAACAAACAREVRESLIAMADGYDRANILFSMADQLRFDALSAVTPTLHTPHLDQLAKEGVRFLVKDHVGT